MKHLLHLLFACFTVSTTLAQKTNSDTITISFDEQLMGTTPDNAVYTGYAVKAPQGWTAVVFDDAMKVVARGNYASQKCKEKQGWFTYYFADGKRAASGQYHRDKRIGIWRTWYPEGRVRDSIEFEKGKPSGTYYSYFQTGRLSAIGKFKDGLEDSTWTWYHSNGKVASSEEYKKGELKGQRCLDSNGLVRRENCYPYLEPMTTRKETIWQVVYDSLKIPLDKDGSPMEGKVMVSVDITEKGEIRHLTVVPGANHVLDSLVGNALAARKHWSPAYDHNRPVAYVGTIVLPINQKIIAGAGSGTSPFTNRTSSLPDRPWYAENMYREPERFTPYGFIPGINKIDQ
jgi:hypothetical protein